MLEERLPRILLEACGAVPAACQEGGDQEPHSLTKVKSRQLTPRPRYQKWALLQPTLPGDVHTPGLSTGALRLSLSAPELDDGCQSTSRDVDGQEKWPEAAGTCLHVTSTLQALHRSMLPTQSSSCKGV